jgi:N-acetylglutamate synthase-like GNAT family acetyltransferase
MKSNITLTPIPTAFVFADQPLDWSIKLWGEGKEEFSADDWRKFYKNAMSSNYSSWNSSGVDQEHLFMAIREEDGKSEVVASIAICDFDDFEEFRKYKPWIAAFIVREDLRGSGIGSKVLKLAEEKAIKYGITKIYLWTEGEREFYGKRGYQFLDQLSKPGRIIDLMYKDLAR